jgi:hypothetical protein
MMSDKVIGGLFLIEIMIRPIKLLSIIILLTLSMLISEQMLSGEFAHSFVEQCYVAALCLTIALSFAAFENRKAIHEYLRK